MCLIKNSFKQEHDYLHKYLGIYAKATSEKKIINLNS